VDILLSKLACGGKVQRNIHIANVWNRLSLDHRLPYLLDFCLFWHDGVRGFGCSVDPYTFSSSCAYLIWLYQFMITTLSRIIAVTKILTTI